MLHEEFVPQDNLQKLQMVHFILPFAILGTGIALSAIIFIFELINGKKNKKIKTTKNGHDKF